ncbi:hypothetical protein PPL_02294 [Heterostelium album PN500]|uniref:Uncharacterized protein n=1 Tax=Heterostelium pallidum (strain ATCC 26659 / Pp 5 / PN500) TaxID=670386 RepID=D3B1W9_HETP5|nr:hypothetical protein PPL_02294 [Heterostelium album PN500]EFA85293.1 hypothetical protein PPL_02294 [Heterostelium album PN500]|eukprot:XP_020437402.1 hypothetical protein PPL_02294 [Heterostelium album PN500]
MKHFLLTIAGPDSSYSSLEIHILFILVKIILNVNIPFAFIDESIIAKDRQCIIDLYMSVSFVFCIFSPPCLNLILYSNELLIILYTISHSKHQLNGYTGMTYYLDLAKTFCPFWNNDGRTSDDR